MDVQENENAYIFQGSDERVERSKKRCGTHASQTRSLIAIYLKGYPEADQWDVNPKNPTIKPAAR